MSGIRDWLAVLGLGRYGDAFEENEITLDIARDLTDADLEKLGVAVMGHRKALLRAIEGLSEPHSVGLRDKTSASADDEQRREPAGGREAERRQITVMFCDLAGSTALSEKLDPEDLSALMTAYRQAASDVVQRYQGFVAQYLGDGVMVYFGWPTAHEDDPNRAVRAALEIVDAVQALQFSVKLAVRVGIATGLVVVGAGEGQSDAQLAVGETPNVAARMQAMADRNTVVIAESTRRLLGRTFELDDLGTHAIKGVSGKLHVYRALGEASAVSRFEATAGDGRLTPFVGREPEMSLLLDRWERAKDDEGQVVLLSGEAGIGKSRLVQGLVEQIGDQPHALRRYQCSPYHSNSALYPVINQMRQAAHFDQCRSEDDKWDNLLAVLHRTMADPVAAAPLLAAMLSIEPGERFVLPDVSPQKLRQLTLQALSDVLFSQASDQALLLIFEDVHWLDPTTGEWLDHVMPVLSEHAALALITYRPEFDAPWSAQKNATTLVLDRVDRVQAAEIIKGVIGSGRLPDTLTEHILDKTDGVPIFIEELTRTIIDIGGVRLVDGNYELAKPLEALAIPATLQDSLMARLDRTGLAKETAQIGACIGRSFSHDLLARVTGIPTAALESSIKKLIDSNLLSADTTSSTPGYVFKHALIQDAAYASLLKSRRRSIHERIASNLEEFEPDLVDNSPELVAHHWTAAEQADRAIPFWLTAGQFAARRSANVEAITHLERGMALISQLSDSNRRLRIELDFRATLGPALMMTKGWAAAEVAKNYDRMLSLSRDLNDDRTLFGATWGLWLSSFVRGDLRHGRSLVDDMFVLAGKNSANDEHALQAHHAAWGTLTWVAEYDAVCEHVEEGLAIYDPNRHHEHALRYGGHDPGVCGHAQLGMAQWFLGFPETAAGSTARALDLANKLGHGSSVLHAITWQGLIALFARNRTLAMELGRRVTSMSTERGLPLYAMLGGVIVGGTLAQGPDAEEGRKRLAAMIARLETLELAILKFMLQGFLAEACRRTGDLDDAAILIETAITDSISAGDIFWLPELERIQGDISMERGADPDLSESSYQRAIRSARGNGSRLLELRATSSLARLWQSQGRTLEARDVLAPIYDWFTEGSDTADLKDAKILLDGLK